MKLSFSLLIFIYLVLNQQEIKSQTDSLKENFSEAEQLEQIFDILSHSSLSSEKSIRLALQARALAQELNDRKSLCLSYKYLGNGYLLKPDYENAIKIYHVALKLAEELNESSIASDCYYNLSLSYQGMGDYAEALKFAKTAFNLDYARNDSAAMAESYNFIGIIYENMGDYDKALSHYFKSLEIIEGIGDNTGIAQRFNNIGIVFYNLGNYQKAWEYFSKSILLLENSEDLREKSRPLISMGDLYERTEKYDSALILFNQALEISSPLDDKSLHSNVLSRIGDVYFSQGLYDKARDYYMQNYEVKLSIKDFDGMVRARYNLARTFYIQEKPDEALINLKQSEKYSIHVKSKKILTDIYQLYYFIYKKEKQNQQALKYLELYLNMKDSLLNEDAGKRIYELNTIYETEKKEKENEILRQTNQIKNLELKKSVNARNYVIVITFLILCLTVILYTRYRNKLRTNQLLQNQNALLEEQKSQISQQKSEIELKNLQITDSILYASLIQKSILPKTEIFTSAFPDSFILYMPRDIVSGDFYWFSQMENKMIVVVADCTGHGVPAAFMSMLGIEMLSEIFENRNTGHSDMALQQLRDGFVRALHQDENGNEDGMDISICIIDKTEHTVEFSGARRPLLYIKDNELVEIKGDKQSIGGRTISKDPYSRHIIHYKSEFSLYLFSDGYPDQFGGPHHGKITYNLFKELIHLNSAKPMKEQQEYLEEFLLNWKGDTIQIDDILVMGIRIS